MIAAGDYISLLLIAIGLVAGIVEYSRMRQETKEEARKTRETWRLPPRP